MHGNFSLTSFILGTSEDSEEIFFDNLDIKKEKDLEKEFELVVASTSSQMPVPDYNTALYNSCQGYTVGAGSSTVSSPVSLPSPMMEVSPAHSPVHTVPTTEDCFKRGLRYALHVKRASQGLGGIEKLPEKRRKRDDELTADELQKRRMRRERNKQAALRCRTRRRERIEALEKETAELEELNDGVEKEISSLRTQIEQLQQMLVEHDCSAGVLNVPVDSGSFTVKSEPDF